MLDNKHKGWIYIVAGIALILLGGLISACGATTLINPDDYDSKSAIYQEEVDFTVYTEVGHKLVDVAVVDDFLSAHGIDKAKMIIRDEFFRCIDCLNLHMVEVESSEHFDGKSAMHGPRLYWSDYFRKHKVIIVPHTFKCFNDQHDGRCHGFYSDNPKMFVLAWERPATNEDLPLFCHEVSHMTGSYKTDHSNLTDELLDCIKYK